MTKPSQDNNLHNLNHIIFLTHFYEYHTVQRHNMLHFKGFVMMKLLLGGIQQLRGPDYTQY